MCIRKMFMVLASCLLLIGVAVVIPLSFVGLSFFNGIEKFKLWVIRDFEKKL